MTEPNDDDQQRFSGAGEIRWGFLEEEHCWVNLTGDYRYLGPGYYASQDLEVEGKAVHPTCKESLDAYIVPLFLEKAAQEALPVPEYYITNAYFEPPVIVDPLNPFMNRQRMVLKPGSQERAARSLTRNFTYAICCQELPPGARVADFRAILGWSPAPRFRTLAALVWKVFRLPLAVVRVIALPDGEVLLSRLKPLSFGSLKAREKEFIEGAVTWPT